MTVKPTSRRVTALRRLMRRAGVGAMLLTDPINVRYFSGFTGEDSYLLVERARVTLLTDGRFAEQARRECPRIGAVVRPGRMLDALAGTLAGQRVRVLGVEGNHLTVTLKGGLDRALKKVRLRPLSGQIDALREVKRPEELAAIGRAVRVAERALTGLLSKGRSALVGRTERQVAAELEYRMRLAGADAPAFPTIVAAGANAALPHYRAGDGRIRRGQPVLIDLGASVGGYVSDLTRVVFTGRIPAKTRALYEIVLRAQRAGLSAVRPGARCAEADRAARSVIESAGYGEAFAHGLGHGIGLEVHESPRLGQGSRQRLSAGMVMTVEPGIYLPGLGGVRIEDDVAVTAGGARRLSRLPRRLEQWVLT